MSKSAFLTNWTFFIRKNPKTTIMSLRTTFLDKGGLLATNLSGNRSLVRIKGKDAFSLLQALVSFDLRKLPPRETRSGVLLNNKGRLLADFLAWKSSASTEAEGEYYMDCDSKSAEIVASTISRAKFRKAVDI